MNHDHYSDAYIHSILSSHRTIAMVGASANKIRPSYFAMKYLLEKGYRVLPINPALAGKTILDQPVFESLDCLKEPVEIVDIFRSSDAILEITKQAIAIGAKVIWMQLGIRNDEAAALAEEAGLKVVMNRCPKIEYGRLSGEIGWVGVNRQIISSARPKLASRGVQHRLIHDKT